jgi:hypothetical protein
MLRSCSFFRQVDLNISFGLPDPPTKRYSEYSFTRYVATSWEMLVRQARLITLLCSTVILAY